MQRWNIADGGAVGDGTTESNAAIQAVIDAASAAGLAQRRRQYVYVPPGVFRVSRLGSALHCLALKSWVTLAGPGTILMAPNQVPNMPLIAVEQQRFVNVYEVTLDCDSDNQGLEGDPKNHAIFTRGSLYCHYEGVQAQRVDGDAFYFGKYTDGVIAQFCKVIDMRVLSARRSGVTVTAGASDILIRGGTIADWSGDQSAALNIETDGGDPSTNITFDGVTVLEPKLEQVHTSTSISSSGCVGLKVRNCRLESASIITSTNDVDWDRNITNSRGRRIDGSSGLVVRLVCDRVRIRRSEFTVLQGEGGRGDGHHVACIYVTNTNDNTPSDVTVEDCVLRPRGLYGAKFNNLHGITRFQRNRIEGAGVGAGLAVYVPNTNTYFEDMRIRQNTFVDIASTAFPIEIFSTGNGAGMGLRALESRYNTFIARGGTPVPAAYGVSVVGSSPFPMVRGGGDVIDTTIASRGLSYWCRRGELAGGVGSVFEGDGVPAFDVANGSRYHRLSNATRYKRIAGAWVLQA